MAYFLTDTNVNYLLWFFSMYQQSFFQISRWSRYVSKIRWSHNIGYLCITEMDNY